MFWYVVHTKPRQETRALLNLEQQGYHCFLPTTKFEKLRSSGIAEIDEALFPRYLFIQLDPSSCGKSWAPIRSTKGVSRLVTFGGEAARVSQQLIDALQKRQSLASVQPLFSAGDNVRLTSGPFSMLDAVYEMRDAESRALVLIEILSKPVRLVVPATGLRRAE
ncbi:MAG: rfaH [Paucimonas sp.]|nr:rfaH [Paucimonas sp.]